MRKILFVIGTLILAGSALRGQTPSVMDPSITGQVTVRRDSRSIPYIDAKTDADAYFVQGYVTASDRLWQMDLLRRVARGETAEIFGKATLEEDKRWRRFGFARIAEDSIAHLSPELQLALVAYARGVNAYISGLNDSTLPIEFKVLQYKPREWKPSDSVIIGKILADALSSTWRNDLLRASVQSLPADKIADLTNQVTPYDVLLFGKDAPKGQALANPRTIEVEPATIAAADAIEHLRSASLARIGMYAEDLAASNNWVISGKRTADGKAMLANDPHLLPSTPGIWYLTHLTTPSMRVSGVTFPGVPGIVLGHNGQIAWGATNVGPDVQDIYVETFNAEGKYKMPDGSFAAPVTRREEIKVRLTPLKTDTETVSLDVVVTRNGPVFFEEGGKRYSLRWTAFDPKNNEFEAFYFLNRANNWTQFKDALKNYGGATQNFVYADTKGNIGWYAAGRIPLRKTGDGGMPYDGATDDGAWTGFIPFDELPNLYNPAEGFIVTANQRIVGTAYKYQQMSRDAAAPWRARRIYDLLKANTKVTMDDVSRVQHDSYNIPLANLSKEIVASNAASAETIELLKAWDGRMTPDSKAALIANEIRVCIANKMADANRPAPAAVIRERVLDWAVKEKSSRWLPDGFADYPALIRRCDSEAGPALAARYRTDLANLTWGNASAARFPHPLAIAPLIGGQFATPTTPLEGSGQTPNVASYVSMRHIASPGNWDATRHVIPMGQSGDPKSPHYKDQFDLWRTGAPAVFPFTRQAVEGSTKIERVFAPGAVTAAGGSKSQ